jgi:serine/threonine protein kinase
LHERRQEAEIQLVRTLALTGFPRYLADGVDSDGRRYLSYKPVAGSRLRNLVGDSAPLSPGDWWSLAEGLLRRLQALHGLSPPIFHGDVSACNVIWDRIAGIGLIDFGVARSLRLPFELRFPARLSCAAPRYLSPEQAQGKFWASPSDIFQAGLLLLELHIGEPVNWANTPRGALELVRQRPELARSRVHEAPEFARPILYLMLAPRPCSRPRAATLLARYFSGR